MLFAEMKIEARSHSNFRPISISFLSRFGYSLSASSPPLHLDLFTRPFACFDLSSRDLQLYDLLYPCQLQLVTTLLKSLLPVLSLPNNSLLNGKLRSNLPEKEVGGRTV